MTGYESKKAAALDRVLYNDWEQHTAPQQRPWVGLTDEEIYSVLENLQVMYNRPPTTDSRIIFARALENALRSKNNGT